MQQQTALTVSLGGAVEDAVAESLDGWRAQHKPSATLEEARLEHMHLLTAELQMRGFGLATVSVSIKARRPWESETYWYTYRKAGDGEYTRHSKA